MPGLQGDAFLNLVILDDFPTKDRESNTGIIATGQHKSIQQLFNGINLPNF